MNNREIETYISDISGSTKYRKGITVEHRSGNPKRDYLFVNKYQCKHLPSSPTKMFNMCLQLIKKCDNIKDNDRVLIIGFAETATAISKIMSKNMSQCKKLVNTTRENIELSSKIVEFKEEHSHAVEQYLLAMYNSDIDHELSKIDYILFVDDEITTGKTILNCINVLKNKYNITQRIGVASICNWQSDDDISKFNEIGIDRYYLVSGKIRDTSQKIENCELCSNKEHDEEFNKIVYIDSLYNYNSGSFLRERVLTSGNAELDYIISDIANDILERQLKDTASDRLIRVIGSEECMYPAIMVGKLLEQAGFNVVCHSTTRSKIDVMCGHTIETIYKRNKVASAYDIDRNTYIYNLSDNATLNVIISDTQSVECFNNFVQSIANVVDNGKSRIIAYNI